LTGRRLALMHLTTDVLLVAGSALVAAIFLGGPGVPVTVTPLWFSWAVGFFLFLLKTLFVVLILSSIKVATGRIRIDQLNNIGWKYIASAALLQVAIVLVINYIWVSS
jgi:NADH-quinone oxidoreductase subunit H